MVKKAKTSCYTFPHPMDNEYLVGHATTLNNFMNAWNGRDAHPIHHAWMFTGQRGIGKATMAYKLAKMVYGNVGDFFIIDSAHNIDKDKKPKPDGKISVYTVREIIDKMQMSSMSGDWRVILIDSLDEMTTAAANAILKLLEEPPAKTLFLLISHSLASVLPTVRSRTRVEKMRPLSISELRDLCAKFIPEEPISPDILKLVNGSFGKIAELKQSGGDEIYAELVDVLQNSGNMSSDLMAIAKKIAPNPELYSIILDVVAQFGLAELYPVATKAIKDITTINIEPEIAIFKILCEIKKCL